MKNEKVLIVKDHENEDVMIRERISPLINDRVIVQELQPGEYVTHGIDQFKVDDHVLVFDDLPNPLMLRICAEQPPREFYDWIDGTMQGWEQISGSNQSGVIVKNSSVFGKYCLDAYHYAGYPVAVAEEESDWCYGTWTMRFFITTHFYHGQVITARFYFIMKGSDYYYVEIDTVKDRSYSTMALYKNDILLDRVPYDNEEDKVHTMKITRDWNGYMTVSVDGVEYIDVIDNSITSSQKMRIWFDVNSFGKDWAIDYIQFDELV
ncbi:MAG: hypothetical protein A4E25_00416 [Methanobacterium sp. PtaB.Bin024]|nr:MAG: hypothetical protein A4E25_00416 [Methanobacterium sp. PtaB.Bin024]